MLRGLSMTDTVILNEANDFSIMVILNEMKDLSIIARYFAGSV